MSATLPNFVETWLQSEGERPPLLLTSPLGQPLEEIIELIAAKTSNVTIVTVDSARITIKDIRGVISEAAHTSWSGPRLILIPQAERLTDPAANALLKLLEESSSHTSFILLSQWPTRLLETIRSRCSRIRLSAPVAAPVTSKSEVSQGSLIQRLVGTASDKLLSSEDLYAIEHALENQLRIAGPSPALRRAFTRLRDYHLIASRQGNTKLAKDVLLASLPDASYSK
jgi:DNA polymerase III delta prime subunit